VLRFPKGITGIAVAAVLLVLGNVSGHAQFAPNAGATPGPETRRQLELLGKVSFLHQFWNFVTVARG